MARERTRCLQAQWLWYYTVGGRLVFTTAFHDVDELTLHLGNVALALPVESGASAGDDTFVIAAGHGSDAIDDFTNGNPRPPTTREGEMAPYPVSSKFFLDLVSSF